MSNDNNSVGEHHLERELGIDEGWEMKKYTFKQVEEAMHEQGYTWVNPRRKLRSIDKMVQDLPRCVLEQLGPKLPI